MVALAVVALVVAELQQVVGLQQVAGLIVGLVYLSQMMGLLLQLKWACW